MLRFVYLLTLSGILAVLALAMSRDGSSSATSKSSLADQPFAIHSVGSNASQLLALQTTSQADKIAPELRQEFSAAPGGKVRYFVVLAVQADTRNDITEWVAKGRYVLDTLRGVANATQPLVRAQLGDLQKAGHVASFKSYYIVNAFQVVGNLTSAEALASRADVARIEAFPVITLDTEAIEAPASPEAIEWNVNYVRAPQAWAMGYTGVGTIIGGLDTGVRYTHQSLVGKYRGNLGGGNFDHNYNWWPAVGTSQSPVDTDGHGTHTIGTALGDDGGANQIGVAPGAQWIASNGIAPGLTDPDIIEAGQWMLAPTNLAGQNPDPARRPHVVSNSWGYGSLSFNCPTATFFRTVVQQWVAAGIFPSFSAGNGGTSGNRPPAAYPETFETGNITINWVISGSSSRGPSCFDGRQHPQVVTGGTSVRSAYRTTDTTYSILSGTSMAQPATAGAVAILREANPNLTIPQIWYLLTSTAVMSPSWGTAPNSTYGWGIIQLDAAVNAARQTCQPGPDYGITPSTGAAIVPGTTQIPGSNCNACTVNIGLPFSYDFYGTMYNSVVASNKGNLQFTGNSSSGNNACLPTNTISDAILGYWDDINTNIHDNMGIWTSTSGSAPNRIFNIEWRGGFESNDATVNFEVRLYEGQPKFEVVYGTTRGGGFSATVGVQEGTGSHFTQHSCDQTNAVPPGTKLTFDRRVCAVGPAK